LKVSPGAPSFDDLRLVQADDRFSQCIVARIAGPADGRLDPRIAQLAGVTDRKVLRSPVAVMNQAFCVFLGHTMPVPGHLGADPSPVISRRTSRRCSGKRRP
jgi:hypothetical protein